METFSHAIVAQIPDSIKFEEKKQKGDIELLKKQQEDFVETLRQAHITVVELPREKDAHVSSLLIHDNAIVIGGTALICRRKKESIVTNELRAILTPLVWKVYECPEKENGKIVVLDASDVLYTGHEIFVGTRKHGTNIEGAMVLGRVFADKPVVQVVLPNNTPLKAYVSLAAKDILAVGASKDAQLVLKRIEHEATFRYKTITCEDDASAHVLLMNNRLVVRQDRPEPKFTALKNAGLELWALDVSEVSKFSVPFTRLCLLFKQTSKA